MVSWHLPSERRKDMEERTESDVLHKVRFETHEGYTHVYLDDQEVQGCIKANFDYDVACVPVVQLTLYATDVEVEADVADICKVSEESIETLDLSAGTINILRFGFWYNKNHERLVDPVRTIGKLLQEYKAGRIMKYKGLGASRYCEISRALGKRGLI